MHAEGTYPPYLQDHLQDLRQALEPYAAWLHGNALGSILVVKAIPGPAEEAGAEPFSGEDGTALDKAFAALGYGDDAWLGIYACISEDDELDAKALATIASLITPAAVVACDSKAAALCRKAALDGFQGPRAYVELKSFEASLEDDAAKKKEWAALKTALQRR